MAERKIVVPEGMMKAAQCAGFRGWTTAEQAITLGLEAALRWLSENPIEPTEEQAQYMYDGKNGFGHAGTIRYCMIEWQRRMFLAPEPEIPEEIRDIVESNAPEALEYDSELLTKVLMEAYCLGQKEGKS